MPLARLGSQGKFCIILRKGRTKVVARSDILGEKQREKYENSKTSLNFAASLSAWLGLESAIRNRDVSRTRYSICWIIEKKALLIQSIRADAISGAF